jgi:hypothetical protein
MIVKATPARFLRLTVGLCAVVTLAGCSAYTRDGRSPARLVINTLQGASGADNEMGSILLSDVSTIVTDGCMCATIFNDPGEVEFRLQLRDIGNPLSPTEPSPLNAVTVDRYHVKYVRSDGRNTQGVDVPYEFDGAATVTVPADGTARMGFNWVRQVAKREAPLAALVDNDTLITVIAYVTFYGHDQAGNNVSVTGQMDITFANFGDPS